MDMSLVKLRLDGNGNATIKPTTPIPEGEVTVRAHERQVNIQIVLI